MTTAPTAPEIRQQILADQDGAARGQTLSFMIERQPNGLAIGWIGFQLQDEGTASLGYYLGAAFQGRGYMIEAARAALTAAWTRLPVDAIEAGAQLGNTASFAVMRALGMAPADERLVFAAARGRDERCLFHRIERPNSG